METWLILLIVVAACACLIGSCARCAVRRFTPENQRGPQWEVNSKGERWVPARNQVPRDDRLGWMWNEGDREAPDRLPVAPKKPGPPVRASA
jgi:hypothetical protein